MGVGTHPKQGHLGLKGSDTGIGVSEGGTPERGGHRVVTSVRWPAFLLHSLLLSIGPGILEI